MASVAKGMGAEGRGEHTRHFLVGRRHGHGRWVRVGAVFTVLAAGAAFLVAYLADDVARRLGRVRLHAHDAFLENATAAAGLVEGAWLRGHVYRLLDHL